LGQVFTLKIQNNGHCISCDKANSYDNDGDDDKYEFVDDEDICVDNYHFDDW
jgi:hypothetical protein